MKRTETIKNNYKKEDYDKRHILITGNLEDVIISDFEEYLQDHNIINISIQEKTEQEQEKIINNYIISLFYQMQDTVEDLEEQETLQDFIYRILNNYCYEIPF